MRILLLGFSPHHGAYVRRESAEHHHKPVGADAVGSLNDPSAIDDATGNPVSGYPQSIRGIAMIGGSFCGGQQTALTDLPCASGIWLNV